MNRIDRTIEEIRTFNRFYTASMGFLNSGYLDTRYSMAETRILFEMNMHGTCIQSNIVKALHIDKSYLSRIVQRFCKKGLAKKVQSDDDRRATHIALTKKGRAEAERLVALTNRQLRPMIKSLNSDECKKLRDAMGTMRSILGKGERHEGDSV